MRAAADRFPFACRLRNLLAYSPSITNVHFCRVTLALITSCLLAWNAYSQSSVTTPPERPLSDRSFYFDKPVSHPEALSGVWEAPDGKDGAVGIHLQLTTAVSGDADPPVWTPQSWKHLDVGVFQRRGPELEFGEENYFSDDLRGGSVKLEDGRLQLHFISSIRDTPSVDLDLVRQPSGCWRGRFHRGAFDSAVTLCRPTPGPDVPPSPLVGTWSQSSSLGSACIHIAQTGPATFTGWSDLLDIPGRTVFGRDLQGHGSSSKITAFLRRSISPTMEKFRWNLEPIMPCAARTNSSVDCPPTAQLLKEISLEGQIKPLTAPS